MGLLSEGQPLSWEETKKYADHVRQHGVQVCQKLFAVGCFVLLPLIRIVGASRDFSVGLGHKFSMLLMFR